MNNLSFSITPVGHANLIRGAPGRGFTLNELLVVIAIPAVFSSVSSHVNPA